MIAEFTTILLWLVLSIFFLKQNNSSLSRAIFIIFISIFTIIFLLSLLNEGLILNIANSLRLTKFQLIICLNFLFVFFSIIYIYLELKKIKHKLTIKIRNKALNENYGKSYKKKIK